MTRPRPTSRTTSSREHRSRAQPAVGRARAARHADGQRRPAGFKTGTTNDFRDVSGFGYVPGSLTTGVWMGNNNQEPMSNEFSGGLFSADGPLFLWQDFMELALNQPWDWNGNQPGRADELRPAGGDRERPVCRWSGMAATNAAAHDHAAVPGGDGPAVRQRPSAGCLDLELYVSTPCRIDRRTGSLRRHLVRPAW